MIVRQRLGEGPGENGLSMRAVRPTVPSSSSSHSAELQEILQMILEQSDHLVDCDASALLLLTDDTLHVVASRGIPDPEKAGQLRFNLKAQPNLRRLLEAARPVVSPDVQTAEPGDGIAALEGLHACIRAPLVYRDRPIGLLILLKAELEFYSEKDAQFAMAFAGQAAMAIENARLYAEARRRARQLEATSQAGQKVTSILEINELLAEVVRLIREQLGYDHVHLFLVDGHSHEIALREYSGHADESVKARGLRLKIGEQGITGWVAVRSASAVQRRQPGTALPPPRTVARNPVRIGRPAEGRRRGGGCARRPKRAIGCLPGR
jgi:GAF domain-containing protein